MVTTDATKPSDSSYSLDDELLSIVDRAHVADVVNSEYQEIIKLCGLEVACKLFRHFRGCRVDFPKYFYKLEYVIQVASAKEDKRERERVAIVAGYTAQWLERKIREYNSM